MAARLTSVPGSSDVFLGGTRRVRERGRKQQALTVPAAVLEEFGAVPPQTAAAMAQGVRTRLGEDVGIAVTGIAGPGGARPKSPLDLLSTRMRRVRWESARASCRCPATARRFGQRSAALALHPCGVSCHKVYEAGRSFRPLA